MIRRVALSLAFLSQLAGPARGADIFPEVYGVAQFPNSAGPKTDLITFGTVLPGGGRAFDFGQFGQGGALCSTYTGQADWLCASASARVEIDRQLVATSTYVGTATAVRLKAQVHLDFRNATATSAQIWAKASLTIPLACNGGAVAPVGGLHVLYRLDGDHSVDVSDSAVIVKAPRPFETCTPGGVCIVEVPTFDCPDDGFTTSLVLDLWPIVQIDNAVGHTGWSVQAVSDYSHTFTLEGIDAVDDEGQPLADVRLVVPGEGDTPNEVFLTGAEAAELAAGSTTTTTSTSTTSSTATGASTTSTTTPACATGDLAAAGCRCALGPAAGCEGVTLRGPVAKGVNGLCAKIAKATAASGSKRRRLAKQAVSLTRKALRAVNGRKGADLPDACRDGLRDFLQSAQTEVATATH